MGKLYEEIAPELIKWVISVVGYVASGAAAFTAQLTQVCISPETRPVTIPAPLREVLAGDTAAPQ